MGISEALGPGGGDRSVGFAASEAPAFQGDAAHPEYRRYLEQVCQANPQIFIELSSVCNFHCFYCESPNHERKAQVSDELFYRALDQAVKMTTQPIRFHCDGEPTVHRKFYDYAKAVNDRGRRIDLASNGSNLQSRFLDLKMNINVHLSTTSGEFKLRSTLSFARHLRELQAYIDEWRESSAEQTIAYNLYLTSEQRRSPTEMARLRAFVSDFVAAAGFAGGLSEDLKPNSVWFLHRKSNGYQFRIAALSVASGGMYPDVEAKKAVTLRRDFGFCDSPWKRLVILSDGSLQPCCLDLKGTLAYTQPEEIHTASLAELWNNDPRIKKIREEALAGTIGNPTCQKCLDRLPSREFYTRFAKQFEPGDR